MAEKLSDHERRAMVESFEESLRAGGHVENTGEPTHPIERTQIIDEMLSALQELTAAHVALGGVLAYAAHGFTGYRAHEARLRSTVELSKNVARRLESLMQRSDAHYELLS